MGGGLAGEKKVKTIKHGHPAEWLMGVKIIPQQSWVIFRIEGGIVGDPALGGRDFTVLFVMAILRCDELRAQWQNL